MADVVDGVHHVGTRRARPASRRPLVIRPLMAGVGLLALGVGMVVGRASVPAPPAPPGPAAPVRSGPGPSAVRGGVPVGYAHTPAGAAAAATQYVAALNGRALLDPRRRTQVLDVIATQHAGRRLEGKMTAGLAVLRERVGLTPEYVAREDVAIRILPGGYDVAEYSARRTTVDVWGVGLFVAPGHQVASPTWGRTRVVLRWERGDWRVAEWSRLEGPTPPEAGATGVNAVGRQINSLQPYWYVPEAESR